MRRFWSDRKGNVAILFALAVIPIIGAMGVAVDYSFANALRTNMQKSLDSTGLALSKMMPLTQDQLNTLGNQFFLANFGTPPSFLTLGTAPVTIVPANSKLDLSVTGIYRPELAGILKIFGGGDPSFPIGTTTQVVWGTTRLRVALALDNTGSMSSAGKINALKTATTNLLTQLQNAANVNGDVYVSIIPFARDVNVNNSNYNASWVNNWADWEAPPAFPTPSTSVGPGSNCPYSNGTNGFKCTSGPANDPNCNIGANNTCVSTIPSSGTYKGYICPSVDSGQVSSIKNGVYYNGCYTSSTYSSTGSSATCTGHLNCTCTGSGSGKVCKQPSGYYEHDWVANNRSTWNGCIKDRGNSVSPGTGTDYDQKIDAADPSNTATLFPPQQYYYCNIPMMGQSYDWTTLKNMVNNMTPNGSTNQPIGLVWGWQSLVGGGPLTMPNKDPNFAYTNVIILLSDGLNTQDRWYGNGSSTNTNVDGRMYFKSGSTVTGTCKNIKDANIQIYTVQVNTGGDPTSTLLKNCATTTSMFFELTSADEIVTTFNAIGTNLTNLRLSK